MYSRISEDRMNPNSLPERLKALPAVTPPPVMTLPSITTRS